MLNFIYRIITSDGNEDVDENVSTERHSSVNNYQLYRGMSPTTQNRLEVRSSMSRFLLIELLNYAIM